MGRQRCAYGSSMNELQAERDVFKSEGSKMIGKQRRCDAEL